MPGADAILIFECYQALEAGNSSRCEYRVYQPCGPDRPDPERVLCGGHLWQLEWGVAIALVTIDGGATCMLSCAVLPACLDHFIMASGQER